MNKDIAARCWWVLGYLVLGVSGDLTGCARNDVDGRLVEGPPGPLIIRTIPEKPGGGTMHYAERVAITLAGHAPMVVNTDIEAGVLAPYVSRQYDLGGRRYLLLGHSSWGAGTETVHAMLVGLRGGRLAQLDQVSVTTSRGQSAVILRQVHGQVQIGVFEPTERECASGHWWLARGKYTGEDHATLPTFGPPPQDFRDGLVFMSSLVLGRPDEDAVSGRRVAWFTPDGNTFRWRTDYPPTDYIEAINKRLSDGATAENNAAVPIALAIGPDLFPAASQERAAKLLGIKWEAGASHLDLSREARERLRRMNGEPWKAKDNSELAKWLKDNASYLDAIAAAASRPRYYMPVVPPDGEPLTTATMYRVEPIRLSGLALIVRTHLAIGEAQDIGRAWADLLAVHRLGLLLLQDSTGAGVAAGLLLCELADEQTQQMAMALKIDQATLRKMLADVQKLRGSFDPKTQMTICDRALVLDLLEKAGRSDTGRATEIIRAALTASFAADHGETLARAARDATEGIAADPQAVQRKINEYYDLLAFAIDGGLWPACVAQAEAQPLPDYIDSCRRAAKHPPADGEDKVEWAAKALIAASAHGLEQVPIEQRRFEARHRLSVLALALALHKARNGEYPRMLDVLSHETLKAPIPDDPFAAGPFHYGVRKDGGFDLYSVGPDGRDDKGAGDDVNCGNFVVVVLPKMEPPEIKIPDVTFTENPVGGGSGPRIGFFGSGHNTHRDVYVVDPRVADGKTLDHMRAELTRSLSKLAPTQRFIVLVAGEKAPAASPGNTFSPAVEDSKLAAVESLKSLRADPNADLLAAVKKACELHKADDASAGSGRTIFLMCAGDPPEDVAQLIEAASTEASQPADRRKMIKVSVYVYGREDTATPNARRIAEASGGTFRVVPPEPTSQAASSPSSRPSGK